MNKLKVLTALFVVAFSMMLLLTFAVIAMGSINISKSNITVYENPAHGNHSVDFELDFNPEPTDTVTISYSTNAECELRHESGGYTTGGALVSSAEFHQFSVRAIDDNKDDGNHTCSITYSTTSSDSNYNGYVKNQTVNVIDNNDQNTIYDFSIIPISSNSLVEGSTTTHEYGVQVSTPPRDTITVYASGGEQCKMFQNNIEKDLALAKIPAGSTNLVTFRAVAIDDDSFEGSHECTITHSTSTDDTKFSGVNVPSYSITVADNDKTFLQEQADAQSADNIDELSEKYFGTLDFFDANNDGVVDAEQDNVLNFVNPISNKRHALVIENNNGCKFIGSVDTITEQELKKPQPSLHFPHGLYEYRAECRQPAADLTITLFLDDKFSDDHGWLLRKVSPDGKLVTLTDAEFGTRTVQNGEVTTVSFNIREGGPFDDDGITNGVIVDPFGLALAADLNNDATGLLARVDDTPFSASQTYLALTLGAFLVLSVSMAMSQKRVHQWLMNHKPNHPKIIRIDHF